MIYTAVIRQRGQLTIPDKIREMFTWLNEGEAISVEVENEKVVLKPNVVVKTKEVDWDEIWRGIRLTRSFKSRGDEIPASQFIIKDRHNH